MTTPDLNALERTLDGIPRRILAVTPTPLLPLDALRNHLSDRLRRPVPRILAKLDAWTGFGLGGNKVRKLEHEISPDRLAGVTCLVTAGGPESNHARVTAAVAAWLGLDCVLVLNGESSTPDRGNAGLHRRFGARIISVEGREDRDAAMAEAAREVARGGGRARVIPLGASTPLGALGYVRASLELARQLRGATPHIEPVEPSELYVFVASSSCGTLAGLFAGLGLVGFTGATLVGVSADASEAEILETTAELAGGAQTLLDMAFDGPALVADTSWIGEGYGRPTPASERAARLFGRHAGLVVDQTYTAKAAAGLLDWIEAGRIDPDATVVFWHTGGWPAAV